MNQYKLKFISFFISITLISMSLLSAQCADDHTGAYTGAGSSCAAVAAFLDCTNAGYAAECPVTCNTCPSGYDGCDLPTFTLSIHTNGEILYNTSKKIAGFEFKINGVTLTSATPASGGSSGDANFTITGNPTLGKVLAYAPVGGDPIPAGCGLLTRLAFTGTPTEVHSITVSDETGTPHGFTFGSVLSGTLSIVQMDSNIPTEFSISQNYPNPFNPVTSIAFDVIEMDEISLIVYDLSGKEIPDVEYLVDEI